MGLYLIADTMLNTIISVSEVAIMLGLVIFVHELGHFAVAKLCGVKCEKFYLGFDIYGLKLAKFTYGETEYGIGILPLGGYVKMLGQEDNPARVAEELERAKLAHQPGAQLPSSPTEAEREAAEEAQREHHLSDVGVQGFDASGQPIYNPRSYMAKSVPQRMAIISAGVIMNIIFAFVVASIAYWMGVLGPDYSPVVVGGTAPGGPAWQAALKVDDEVVRIADVENPQFRELRNAVTLGNLDEGVNVDIHRAATGTTDTINIVPDSRGPFAMIGLSGPRTLEVFIPKRDEKFDGPQLQSEPPLENGDEIVAIGGEPAKTYGDLTRALARHPDQPLVIDVIRGKTQKQAGERISVEVAPRPMRTLGLRMQMGAITAVQNDSPAAKAGLRAGDRLIAIDDQPIVDPIRLPDEIRKRAGETVSLTIERADEDETQTIENVELRPTTEFSSLNQLLTLSLVLKGQPIVAPGLGVAYRVLNRVESVVPEGPAAGNVEPGQKIVGAKLIPPEDAKPKGRFKEIEFEIADGDEEANFPTLLAAVQEYPDGSKVELTLTDGSDEGEPKTVTLEPRVSKEWFNPERFLDTQQMKGKLQAETLAQALELGGKETKGALLMVFSFLQKIGGQISPRMLGGPITIFNVAKEKADAGLPELLIFAAMLSANLAVINFLPIPVLDGGHMVFLALEGIRGKPVGERVLVSFQTAGFLFIVGLMAFVLLLDTGLIPRF